MENRRVVVLLLDSLGIGASLDAPRYGDIGANTFAHIHEACLRGEGDKEGLRQGKLNIPNLARVGLYHVALASSGDISLKTDLPSNLPASLWGYAVEESAGKDTPSGHWEIAGVPVMEDWGYFPHTIPCFPEDLINAFLKKTALPGVLGQKHASGTEIIEELGEEHMRSGKPIVYTSQDSVFQIAAHESTFGLERLYEMCEIARELLDPYRVGRVIARPFIGEPQAFRRTGNRRDYTMPPPLPTLLDHLKALGREVIAIGKTADIFAHQGITQTIKADGNMALFDATVLALKEAPPGSLIFTNFVDFDSSYGHRRDVPGYAHALEALDKRLMELPLAKDDWVVITADHGCDPTFPGSDHTREHVPVIVFGPNVAPQFVGRRDSFADIGQSIASYLGLSPLSHGVSFF